MQQSHPAWGKVTTGLRSSFKKSASISPQAVNVYESETARIYSVDLDVTNLEERFSNLPALIAHFQSPDGTVFPANISEIKSKIGPKSKAVLTAWSVIPKDYDIGQLQLLLGEAVLGVTTEGYVNAVRYELPTERNEVQDDLTQVKMLPYTVTIRKINTWLDRNELRLTFNYEISKDLSVVTSVEGRKLVLDFEDEKGNLSFSREFDFKDFETGGEDKLKLGKEEGFRITVKDPDLIFKLQTLKTYKLNLYEQFQGQNKLLAETKVDWFTTTD